MMKPTFIALSVAVLCGTAFGMHQPKWLYQRPSGPDAKKWVKVDCQYSQRFTSRVYGQLAGCRNGGWAPPGHPDPKMCDRCMACKKIEPEVMAERKKKREQTPKYRNGMIKRWFGNDVFQKFLRTAKGKRGWMKCPLTGRDLTQELIAEKLDVLIYNLKEVESELVSKNSHVDLGMKSGDEDGYTQEDLRRANQVVDKHKRAFLNFVTFKDDSGSIPQRVQPGNRGSIAYRISQAQEEKHDPKDLLHGAPKHQPHRSRSGGSVSSGNPIRHSLSLNSNGDPRLTACSPDACPGQLRQNDKVEALRKGSGGWWKNYKQGDKGRVLKIDENDPLKVWIIWGTNTSAKRTDTSAVSKI